MLDRPAALRTPRALLSAAIQRWVGVSVFGAAALCIAQAAAQEETPLCHFDNPGPYKIWLDAAIASGERGPAPDCAPPEPAQTYPEQLALPLPCGHALYMRRVGVPLRDALDHYPVSMGDSRAVDAKPVRRASASPREEPLAGPFRREVDGESFGFFYIGAYELTAAQKDLIDSGLLALDPRVALNPESDECRAHIAHVYEAYRPLAMPPAVGLSWFDAVDAARRITGWLLSIDRLLLESGAAPVLPWREGSTGFLRLPTDAEWEYAARGGRAGVGPGAPSRPLYTVEIDGELTTPEIGQIAVVETDDGALVGGVGRRAPNRLGLYDTIGNAAEYVQDLFRATRPDGLLGQTGAALLRGGYALTPPDAIGLGYRVEAELYNTSGEVRPRFAGVRLALSAPFFVGGASADGAFVENQSNEPLFDSIDLAMSELTNGSDVLGARQRLRAVLADLDGDDAADAANKIQEARTILDAVLTAQEETRRIAVRDSILSTAGIQLGVERTGRTIDVGLNVLEYRLNTVVQSGTEQDRRNWREAAPRLESQLSDREIELKAVFNVYESMVGRIAESDSDEVSDAFSLAEAQASDMESPLIVESLALLKAHVAEARAAGAVGDEMRSRWIGEIDAEHNSRPKRTQTVLDRMRGLR